METFWCRLTQIHLQKWPLKAENENYTAAAFRFCIRSERTRTRTYSTSKPKAIQHNSCLSFPKCLSICQWILQYGYNTMQSKAHPHVTYIVAHRPPQIAYSSNVSVILVHC